MHSLAQKCLQINPTSYHQVDMKFLKKFFIAEFFD